MLTAVRVAAVIAASYAALVAAVIAASYVSDTLARRSWPARRPDPVDAAYDTLPAGRPLRIDTRTGSHDALPIRDDIRATLTAYCEGMWHTNGDVK